MTEVLSLTPPRDEQTEQPAQDLIPVGSLEPCKGERLLRTAFKISLNIAFSEKENSKQCEIFRPRVVGPKI